MKSTQNVHSMIQLARNSKCNNYTEKKNYDRAYDLFKKAAGEVLQRVRNEKN